MDDLKSFEEKVLGVLNRIVHGEHAAAETTLAAADPRQAARHAAKTICTQMALPRMESLLKKLSADQPATTGSMEDLHWCECHPTLAERKVSLVISIYSEDNALHVYSKATRSGEDFDSSENPRLRQNSLTVPLDAYNEQQVIDWIEKELIECVQAALQR